MLCFVKKIKTSNGFFKNYFHYKYLKKKNY